MGYLKRRRATLRNSAAFCVRPYVKVPSSVLPWDTPGGKSDGDTVCRFCHYRLQPDRENREVALAVGTFCRCCCSCLRVPVSQQDHSSTEAWFTHVRAEGIIPCISRRSKSFVAREFQ